MMWWKVIFLLALAWLCYWGLTVLRSKPDDEGEDSKST